MVLPYRPLSPAVLSDIIRLQLDRVVARVGENLGARLDYDEAVVGLIASRCQEVASGGRMIDAILTNSMLPELSTAVLERQVAGGRLTAIHVGADGRNFTYRYADRHERAAPQLEAAE
jgi:type VI secretion system protein VasG